jgi:ankyrin repeat protein
MTDIDVNARDHAGNTKLMHAVIDRKHDRVRLLLDEQADPNAQNFDGKTALMYAALRNSDEDTRVLLSAGADTTLVDRQGDTAEHMARGSTKQVFVAHREQQVLRQAAGLDEQEPSHRIRRM